MDIKVMKKSQILKSVRLIMGLTQKAASKLAGVSEKTYGNYERGLGRLTGPKFVRAIRSFGCLIEVNKTTKIIMTPDHDPIIITEKLED